MPPRQPKQEAAETKAADYVTETSPVVIEQEEGHYMAKQKVTMTRKAQQVRS